MLPATLAGKIWRLPNPLPLLLSATFNQQGRLSAFSFQIHPVSDHNSPHLLPGTLLFHPGSSMKFTWSKPPSCLTWIIATAFLTDGASSTLALYGVNQPSSQRELFKYYSHRNSPLLESLQRLPCFAESKSLSSQQPWRPPWLVIPLTSLPTSLETVSPHSPPQAFAPHVALLRALFPGYPEGSQS